MKNAREVAKNAYDYDVDELGGEKRFNEVSELEQELATDAVSALMKSVADDYIQYICDKILLIVVEGVKKTSAFIDEGVYFDDDIRMEIGRTLEVLIIISQGKSTSKENK